VFHVDCSCNDLATSRTPPPCFDAAAVIHATDVAKHA
jgi:hypothetical protein